MNIDNVNPRAYFSALKVYLDKLYDMDQELKAKEEDPGASLFEDEIEDLKSDIMRTKEMLVMTFGQTILHLLVMKNHHKGYLGKEDLNQIKNMLKGTIPEDMSRLRVHGDHIPELYGIIKQLKVAEEDYYLALLRVL